MLATNDVEALTRRRNSANPRPQHTNVFRIPASARNRIWRNQNGLRAWGRRAAEEIERRERPLARGRERAGAD
jgi:hypothetical protein